MEHFEPALTEGACALGFCPKQPGRTDVCRRLGLVCSFRSESLLPTDAGLRGNGAGISLFRSQDELRIDGHREDKTELILRGDKNCI